MTAVRRRLHPLPAEEDDAHVGPLVVKRRPEVDAEVLEREAEVLRALAGGPVVELVDCRTVGGQVELITLNSGSSTLADAAHLPHRTVLRAAAASCRSVVALHRAGWGHGALTLDHVVVGGRGRTTLCSFGRAQPLVAAPELVTVDRSATFAALLLLADELDVDTDDRARRRAAQTIRRAVGPADQDLLEVAAAIESDLADQRDRRGPSARTAVAATGVLTAAVLLAGAWTWTGRSDQHAHAGGVSGPTSTTTSATPVTGRIKVGRPGDEHVVVDLDCDGDDELLVLRPATGELFVAPRVPHDGHDVRTVPAGHLPGATALTTSTTADGCATPLATMPDGSTAPIDLGAGATTTTSVVPLVEPTVATTAAPVRDAATPAPATSPTPPNRATNRVPAATLPATDNAQQRTATSAPQRTVSTTTYPPYEYPIGDAPTLAPDPTEEPP